MSPEKSLMAPGRLSSATNSDALRMTLVLMVVILAGGSFVSVASSNATSVNYVQSETFGNFFIADDMTINSSSVTQTFINFNLCQCRTACKVAVNCKAASLEQVETGSLCHISYENVMESAPEHKTGAKYIFWQDSLPAGTYEYRQEDKLLYFHPSEPRLRQQEAREFCSKIPGHRLGIFKKLQQWPILEYYGYMDDTFMVVDLVKKGGGYFWGDGTKNEDTELADKLRVDSSFADTAFMMARQYPNLINDHGDQPYRVLCQANPLGVPW